MVIEAAWVVQSCQNRSIEGIKFRHREDQRSNKVINKVNLRILQIVQKPQRRGAEVFAFQLSQALRRQEHRVQIAYLYPFHGTNALPLCSDDFILNGQENHFFEKTPGFHPYLLQRLVHLIKQFKPDIIQVNGSRTVKYGAFARYCDPQGDWALIYRNIGNPNDWVRDWYHRFFYERLVMPKLDGVVGVSQTTLQNLLDFYSLSVPTAQIPRAIDPTMLRWNKRPGEIRQSSQTPEQASVILFVGSLTKEKRLDRLLRIVSKVKISLGEVKAWIVGDGPMRAQLEQEALFMGLADTVQFLGVKSNVADYMHAADLLLLTSDTEGIPGVILEAGFLELPTVATCVGGVPECVTHGKTGILVGPEDEAGLVQSVQNLLQNAEERYRMGKAAKEWIEKKFTIDKIVMNYIEFYESVLKSRMRRIDRRGLCPSEATLNHA